VQTDEFGPACSTRGLEQIGCLSLNPPGPARLSSPTNEEEGGDYVPKKDVDVSTILDIDEAD